MRNCETTLGCPAVLLKLTPSGVVCCLHYSTYFFRAISKLICTEVCYYCVREGEYNRIFSSILHVSESSRGKARFFARTTYVYEPEITRYSPNRNCRPIPLCLPLAGSVVVHLGRPATIELFKVVTKHVQVPRFLRNRGRCRAVE